MTHLFQISEEAAFGRITNHFFQFFKRVSLRDTSWYVGNFCPISSLGIGMNDILNLNHLAVLN